MENSKHYPTHPGAEHPPTMTCEIPLEEYESIKRENAELKAEINRKEAVGKRWFERCMEARAENVRLKRALWLARAMRAKDSAYKILRDSGIMFAIGDCRGWDKLNTLQKKWQIVADKCRKKAKEYK